MLADLTSRDSLMRCIPNGGVALELGVQEGHFAQSIWNQNRPSELWLVDCWEQQPVEVYGHDPANVDNAIHNVWYMQVVARFSDRRNVHVLRMYSQEAAKHFPDGFFDLIYFDANHLELLKDLRAWWPKIKPGGWVAGHDYCMFGDFVTVKDTVDVVVEELGVELNVTHEPEFPAWAFLKPQGDFPL